MPRASPLRSSLSGAGGTGNRLLGNAVGSDVVGVVLHSAGNTGGGAAAGGWVGVRRLARLA